MKNLVYYICKCYPKWLAPANHVAGTIFGAFFLCSDAKCLVTRLSQVDKINYYSWFVLSPSLSKAQNP